MTDEAVLENEAKTEKVINPKAKKPLKRYKVTFHSVGDDKSDIVLVHNYVTNVYQRDKPVEIDENFLAVLRDAKLETTRTMRDPATGDNVNEVTSRPAIQYSVDVID